MVNACTANPPIFPRTDIPKLTVAGSPGFGNVSGEVSTALSSACRETDSRNGRREEPPGFERTDPLPFVARFATCKESPFSEPSAGGAPQVSGGSPRLFTCLSGSRVLGTPGPRPQPNRFRIDRNSPNESRVLPAEVAAGTAAAREENRGSPRRPSASQRYNVDIPIPADLAAASRDSPRHSSATTARAAAVVNFD